MLTHLQIRDVALVEAVDLEWAPGFHALTGETGAGKSILMDALGLALGNRAQREAIRAGADTASVQAAFVIAPDSPAMAILREMELAPPFDPEEDLLIIRRDISRQGPSRCWVNGRLVTVSQLQRLGRALVEIHGQHDQQTLLSPAEQLAVIDQFGGEHMREPLAAYTQAYEGWREAQAALAHWEMDEAERARRIDLLRHQVNEIDRAAITPGEDEALEAERRVLRHSEQLAQLVREAFAALYGEGDGGGAADDLAQAGQLLAKAAELDPRLQDVKGALEEALVHVEESRASLRRYADDLEADPARLDDVESRLALLQELRRKYGPTLEAVLAFREQAAAELADLEAYADRRAEKERELAEREAELLQAAAALTDARRRWAQELQDRIQDELKGLRLGDPRLEIRLAPASSPRPTGMDDVQWLFSANPGEPLQPLHKVASGGELSRIMLAVKVVLAEVDRVPVAVFDEVDAGIGGETAAAVGRRLVELSRHRQVLCITHLPQIAALADHQLAVRKEVRGQRTRVRVEKVEGEARVQELARMLGSSVEESTLEHARHLLGMARAEGGKAG